MKQRFLELSCVTCFTYKHRFCGCQRILLAKTKLFTSVRYYIAMGCLYCFANSMILLYCLFSSSCSIIQSLPSLTMKMPQPAYTPWKPNIQPSLFASSRLVCATWGLKASHNTRAAWKGSVRRLSYVKCSSHDISFCCPCPINFASQLICELHVLPCEPWIQADSFWKGPLEHASFAIFKLCSYSNLQYCKKLLGY